MYQTFFLTFLNAACFGPHMQIKICQSRLYHVCLTADATIRFNQVKDVQMARWRRNYRTKISLVQFVHIEIHYNYLTIILQFTRPYFYFRVSWKNVLMRVSMERELSVDILLNVLLTAWQLKKYHSWQKMKKQLGTDILKYLTDGWKLSTTDIRQMFRFRDFNRSWRF